MLHIQILKHKGCRWGQMAGQKWALFIRWAAQCIPADTLQSSVFCLRFLDNLTFISANWRRTTIINFFNSDLHRISYQTSPDSIVGSRKNGSWSGLIGMLVREVSCGCWWLSYTAAHWVPMTSLTQHPDFGDKGSLVHTWILPDNTSRVLCTCSFF